MDDKGGRWDDASRRDLAAHFAAHGFTVLDPVPAVRSATLTVEVRLEGEAGDLDRLQDEARACLVRAVGAGRFLSSRGGSFEFCEVFTGDSPEDNPQGGGPDLGARLFELGAAMVRAAAQEPELARLRRVEAVALRVVGALECESDHLGRANATKHAAAAALRAALEG